MDKNVYKSMMEQAVPNAALLYKTKRKMRKEEPIMLKRSFSAVIAAVVIISLLATTAFAAWYFLKPSEVADKLEDSALSAAFKSENAININQSVTSGDYIFTLLAIVSGKDISDNSNYSNGELRSDRSYVVTAIQKTDGSPMPTINDDNYTPFYISPYIRGQMPWMVNAHTLSGGASEIYEDGVLYRLVEFDNITMFADLGVYIGIIDGRFPNNQAFLVNEQTGELFINPDYDGTNILFELPIDESLADSERAQVFLDELLGDREIVIVDGADSAIGQVDGWAIERVTVDSEGVQDGIWEYNVGEGLLPQEVMTRDEYVEWMEKQLSAGVADREFFERYLRYYDNGQSITIYTFGNGSFTIQVS